MRSGINEREINTCIGKGGDTRRMVLRRVDGVGTNDVNAQCLQERDVSITALGFSERVYETPRAVFIGAVANGRLICDTNNVKLRPILIKELGSLEAHKSGQRK